MLLCVYLSMNSTTLSLILPSYCAAIVGKDSMHVIILHSLLPTVSVCMPMSCCICCYFRKSEYVHNTHRCSPSLARIVCPRYYAVYSGWELYAHDWRPVELSHMDAVNQVYCYYHENTIIMPFTRFSRTCLVSWFIRYILIYLSILI